MNCNQSDLEGKSQMEEGGGDGGDWKVTESSLKFKKKIIKSKIYFQINTKYLSPLFLAYDDRLEERDKVIKRYQVRFQVLLIQIHACSIHLCLCECFKY